MLSSIYKLESNMLIAWMSFLGLVMAAWVYLRWLLSTLLKSWRAHLVEKEGEWERDLWDPQHQVEKTVKLRVLTMKREAYEQVARPLEPYVWVFVVFAVPAVFMSTDYCDSHSDAKFNTVTNSSNPTVTAAFSNHDVSYGLCFPSCELLLAFRSIATVVAYFAWREHRAEVYDIRTLARRLWSRIRSCLCVGSMQRGRIKSVKFVDNDQIKQLYIFSSDGVSHLFPMSSRFVK